MSELKLIKHIDAGIHFDYSRAGHHLNPLTEEAKHRFNQYLKRTEMLARCKGSAMMYFSSFFSGINQELVRDPYAQNEMAWEDELQRVKRYQELLGDRFFLFAGKHKPTFMELDSLFTGRGFTYSPHTTSLLAYGEWFDHCVNTWFEHLKNTLGLDAANCRKEQKLSITYEQEHMNNLPYHRGEKKPVLMSDPQDDVISALRRWRLRLLGI